MVEIFKVHYGINGYDNEVIIDVEDGETLNDNFIGFLYVRGLTVSQLDYLWSEKLNKED
jgi:hypothetical protein